LKERKILVSAQEDAKPSDRSMSAHFIKMTVNGRFSQRKTNFTSRGRRIIVYLTLEDK
jgi:hypothetical protein